MDDEVVEEVAPVVLSVLQVLATPKKKRYKAIASFHINGFREVTEGEFITISPEIIRSLNLEDKVLQA